MAALTARGRRPRCKKPEVNHLDSAVGVIKAMSAKADAFSVEDVQVLNLMSDLIAASMYKVKRARKALDAENQLRPPGDALLTQS